LKCKPFLGGISKSAVLTAYPRSRGALYLVWPAIDSHLEVRINKMSAKNNSLPDRVRR
jgi:hypothetical protein